MKEDHIASAEAANERIQLGSMSVLATPRFMDTQGDRKTALGAPLAALGFLHVESVA
jgi:hypothetical protein